MKILITGAFGNIGKAVIDESYKRGHEITVFEVDNKKTRKDANKYRNKIEKVFFGDIRNLDDINKAVKGCDAVIHLAAIIPPTSKKHREITMEVNYGGTVNLIDAINESGQDNPLVFTSSASVMGPTQLQDDLVDRDDPLVITGNYEESKIRCEEYLRANADNYLIFRLAGVIPNLTLASIIQALSYLEEVFDMHPDMRLEMITDLDVAIALVSGAEKLESGATQRNQAYILGGGRKNGWQLRGSEFISFLFEVFSLPVPDRRYFTQDINAYHLDWYDTEEAQREFCFQENSLENCIKQIEKEWGVLRLPILLFRKIIMWKIEQMSPYYDNPV
ncbi:NAD(P)-dependent oxidoreductase [Candidatus Bathyarchaeota archaeon]|nr:NAD(P)-dependent oxidoreductase [Candidatus Bathyarchaeota archaeon]